MIFVVDSSQEQRLGESLEVLEQCLSNNDLVGIPVLVFANKEDASAEMSSEMSSTSAGFAKTGEPGAGSAVRFRERLGKAILDRDIFQNHGNHHVMGGSAHGGFGVKEGVKWLIEVMKRNQYS